MFLGADAIKLFPSLEQSRVAKLVGKAFLDSEVTISNVDYKEVAKYVAVNWPEGRIRLEGLHLVCPRRKKRRGRKPTMTGKEQSKRKATDDEESLWTHPTRDPTDLEQRRLIAAMVEIAILASFSLHVYSFAGCIYQQKVGGPIGSRLTMAVSQIIMSMLGAKLRAYLSQGEIILFLQACYVDDLRFILSLLPSYMIWDKKMRKFVDSRSTTKSCTPTSPPQVPSHVISLLTGCPQTPPPPHSQNRLHGRKHRQ